MKTKFLKFIVPLFALVPVLAGCNKNNEDEVEDKFFEKYKSQTPTSQVTAYNNYYSDLDFSLNGMKLTTEIHKHCFKKHTHYTLYSELNGYYPVIDKVNASSSAIQLFYTGTEQIGLTNTNREHVWPCAKSSRLWTHTSTDGEHYVDGSGYKGGGSDLYHVRPANNAVNTARGDSKFCYMSDFSNLSFVPVKDTKAKYSLYCAGLTNGQYADKVEVDNKMKGDVARLIAYVYVHYKKIGSVEDIYTGGDALCGGLSLENIFAYSEKRAKQVLCEWNEIDPPSETEILRNTNVQGIQGNRNMFVDYPGLMPRMFGMEA